MNLQRIQDLRVYIPFIDYLSSLDKKKYEKMLQIKGWILENKMFTVEVLEKLEQSILTQYRNLFLVDKKIPQYVMDIFNKKVETKVETINLCSDEEADVEEVDVEEISVISSHNTLSKVPKIADVLDLSDGEIIDTESDIASEASGKNMDKNLEKDAEFSKRENLNDINRENLDEETEALLRRVNNICYKAQTVDGKDKQTLSSSANDKNDKLVFDDDDICIGEDFGYLEKPLFTRRSNHNPRDKDNSDVIDHSKKIIQNRETRREEFNEHNRKKLNPAIITNQYRDDPVVIRSENQLETISIFDDTSSNPQEFNKIYQNEQCSNTACDNENLEKLDIEELTAIFKSLMKCNNVDPGNINLFLKELAAKDSEYRKTRSPSPKLFKENTHTAGSSFSPDIETLSGNTMNTGPDIFIEPINQKQFLPCQELQKIEQAPQLHPVQHYSTSNTYPIVNVSGVKINLNDPRVRQHLKNFQNSPVLGLVPQLLHQTRILDTEKHPGRPFPSAPMQPRTYGDYKRLQAEEMQRRKEAKTNVIEKINTNNLNERNTKEQESSVIEKINTNNMDKRAFNKEQDKNVIKKINTNNIDKRVFNKEQDNNVIKKINMNNRNKKSFTKGQDTSVIEKMNTNNINQRASTKERDTVECVKQVNRELAQESTVLMKTKHLDENGNSSTLNTVENHIVNEATKSSLTITPKNNDKKRKNKMFTRLFKELECSVIGFNKFKDYLTTSATGKRKSSETARDAISKQLNGQQGIESDLSDVGIQKVLPKRRSSFNLSMETSIKKPESTFAVLRRRKTCTEEDISTLLLDSQSDTDSNVEYCTNNNVCEKLTLSPGETSSSDTDTFDFAKFQYKKAKAAALKNKPVVLLQRLTQAEIAHHLRSRRPAHPEQIVLDVQLVQAAARDAPVDIETVTTATKTKSKILPNTDEQMTERTATSCVLCKVKPANLVNHYIRSHKTESYVSRLTTQELENLQKNAFPFAIQCNSNASECTAKYKVQCVFCKDELVDYFINFHAHYSTHTGEYAFQCYNCKIKKPFRADIQSHQNHVKACRKARIQKLYIYPSNLMVIYLHCCRLCNFLQLNEANVYKHLREQHSKGSDEAINVQKYIAAAINDAEIVNELMPTEDDEFLNHAEETLHTERVNENICYEYDSKVVKQEFSSHDSLSSELRLKTDAVPSAHMAVISEANLTITQEIIVKQELSSLDSLCSESSLRKDAVPNAHMRVIPKVNKSTTQEFNVEQELSSQKPFCSKPRPRTGAVPSAHLTVIPEATTQETSFAQKCTTQDSLGSEPRFKADAVCSTHMTVLSEANLATTQETIVLLSSQGSLCSESSFRTDVVPSAHMTVIPKANLTTTQETSVEQELSSQKSFCSKPRPRTGAVPSAHLTVIPEATTQETSFAQKCTTQDSLGSEPRFKADAVCSTHMTVLSEANLATTQETIVLLSSQDSLCSESSFRTDVVPSAHLTVIPEASLTTTQKTSSSQEFSSQDLFGSELRPTTVAVPSAHVTVIHKANLTTTQETCLEQECLAPDSLCSEPRLKMDAVYSGHVTVIPQANPSPMQETRLEQECSMQHSLCCEPRLKTDAVPSAHKTVISKANLATIQETSLEIKKTDSTTLIESEVQVPLPIVVKSEVNSNVTTTTPFFLSRNPVHTQYRTYSGDVPYFGLFKCSSTTCFFSTDEDGEMLKHLNDHNSGKYTAVDFLECSYCQLQHGECGSAQELIAHIKEKHSRSCFQCPRCCYRSCEPGNVALHYSILHSTESDDPFVYECVGNSQSLSEKLPEISKSMLEYVKKLKCIYCSRCFFATKSLIKHLEEDHNSKVDGSCFEEYACIYCVKSSFHKTDMQRHLAFNHPDELAFACERTLKNKEREDSVSNLKLWNIRQIVHPTNIRKPNTGSVDLGLDGFRKVDCVNNLVECFKSEIPDQLDSKPSAAQLDHIWEETVRALLHKLTNNTGIKPDQLYHCPIATCGGFFSTHTLWSRHMSLRHNCILARCPHCPTHNELTLSDFQEHFEHHSRHLHVCFHCIKTFCNESSTVSHFENDHNEGDRFRFEIVKFNIIHSYHIIINEKAYVGRLEFLQAMKELIACRLEVLANEEKVKLLSAWQVPNDADWLDTYSIPNLQTTKNCLVNDCVHISVNEEQLFQHLEVSHPVSTSNKFKCYKCLKNIEFIAGWKSIVEHMQLHNFIYICCVCNFHHFGRQNLSSHIQLEHNYRDVPYVKIVCTAEAKFASFGVIFAASWRTFSTTRICFFCNATNLNAETYIKHLKRVHSVFLKYYCELCNTSLQKLSDINFHYTSNHTDCQLKTSCEFLSRNPLLVRTITPLNLDIIPAETTAGTKRSSGTLTPPSEEVKSKRFKEGNCDSSSNMIQVKRELINDGDDESDSSVEILEDDDVVCTEEFRAQVHQVEKTPQSPPHKIRCINLCNLLKPRDDTSTTIQTEEPIVVNEKFRSIKILKKGPRILTRDRPL